MFDGIRGTVTTRVGRLENGHRSAGATGTETALVADLQTMWGDVRKRKCGGINNCEPLRQMSNFPGI
jgi:hypothetical protein